MSAAPDETRVRWLLHKLDNTAIARLVAAVPGLLAVRRAMAGSDTSGLHPYLVKPLARFEAAAALLQGAYAATVAHLQDPASPVPSGPHLPWVVEEFSVADIALAEAIECRAKADRAHDLAWASRGRGARAAA